MDLPAPSSFSLRADLMYDRHGNRARPAGTFLGTRNSTRLIGGTADVVRRFGKRGQKVRPYIVAGLAHFDIRNTYFPSQGQPFQTQTPTTLGLTYGAGVTFPMGTQRAFVEARSLARILALTAGVLF